MSKDLLALNSVKWEVHFFMHVDLFSDNHGFMWRYAQYGDVSPKVDVYAFGVVLYELISAKEAIVKSSESITADSKGLVGLVGLNFTTKFTITSFLINLNCGINFLSFLTCNAVWRSS
jgi:hypothetical protein